MSVSKMSSLLDELLIKLPSFSRHSFIVISSLDFRSPLIVSIHASSYPHQRIVWTVIDLSLQHPTGLISASKPCRTSHDFCAFVFLLISGSNISNYRDPTTHLFFSSFSSSNTPLFSIFNVYFPFKTFISHHHFVSSHFNQWKRQDSSASLASQEAEREEKWRRKGEKGIKRSLGNGLTIRVK